MNRDPLDIPLTSKLGPLPAAKQTIVNTLWSEEVPESRFLYNEPRFTLYLRYYERECRHSANTVPFQSHREVLSAVTTISCQRDSSGEVLRAVLAEECRSFRMALSQSQNLGITLCLRLWLMINIRDRSDGNIVAGTRTIEWDSSVSVLSFVETKLAGAGASSAVVSKGTLDEEFHVLNLDRLADINIVPTENLADHLYLDRKRQPQRLYVFRCGYFLELHLKPSKGTTPTPGSYGPQLRFYAY